MNLLQVQDRPGCTDRATGPFAGKIVPINKVRIMTVSATSVASSASGALASIHGQASLDDTLFDLAPVSLWLEDFSRVYE